MPNYNSIYTGAQIDEYLTDAMNASSSGASSNFILSSYVDELTMDDTVQTGVIEVGQTILKLANYGENYGATDEYVRYAIAADPTAATAILAFSTDHATEGSRLYPYWEGEIAIYLTVEPGQYYAICNGVAGSAPVIGVMQGASE